MADDSKKNRHQNYLFSLTDELSTKYVFTSILIDGLPVDQCVDLDESSRIHLARLIMDLCLHELFDFLYMQTDPNWSNFFYNPDTRKVKKQAKIVVAGPSETTLL